MSKIKVRAFSISLDGFGAGVNQDLENPLGLRGMGVHHWIFGTKMFKAMTGQEGGSTGVDHEMIEKSFENIGAWILGRNMFGPVRGPWPNDEWKGWWGEEPPYHVPVFVLTNHKRKSFKMKGNTEFIFVTDGIDAALKQAKEAAQGKDIRIGGGVSTIRQFLQAGYIDEIHLAISPVFLGSGEHLFNNLDMPALGFNLIERKEGEGATHLILTKG